MERQQIQRAKKKRRRLRQRKRLQRAAVEILKRIRDRARSKLPAAVIAMIMLAVAYIMALTAVATRNMIIENNKEEAKIIKATELEEESAKENKKSSVEHPFDTMPKDWNGEDLEGFCYHEITEECRKAGGSFPVVAQVYTYITCKNYGVDYEMVFALIEKESECKWDASGDNGTSWGYMQVAPKWHKERMKRLSCTDMTNPYQNVMVGIDYLKEIQDSLQDVPEDVRPYYVLAVYNYGKAGARENLWNYGKYKYKYNTEIMDRAAELKAEKEQKEAKER